jgi:hypothetical protein
VAVALSGSVEAADIVAFEGPGQRLFTITAVPAAVAFPKLIDTAAHRH